MRSLATFVIIFAACLHTMAQGNRETDAGNSVFFEGLGAGGHGSLNYERIFAKKKLFTLGARLGIGLYRIRDYRTKVNPDLTLPVSITLLYGLNHSCEFGIGNTFSSIVKVNLSNGNPARNNRMSATWAIGYRYHKSSGGILFRVTYIPILEFYGDFMHWGGLSLGYSF